MLTVTLCAVQEVAKFYLDLFASLAPNMKFVVQDMTDGNSSCIGVAW